MTLAARNPAEAAAASDALGDFEAVSAFEERDGGPWRVEGFARMFQMAWNRSAWPIKTGQIKFAVNPRFTVARGGLIKAILEEQPLSERHVA